MIARPKVEIRRCTRLPSGAVLRDARFGIDGQWACSWTLGKSMEVAWKGGRSTGWDAVDRLALAESGRAIFRGLRANKWWCSVGGEERGPYDWVDTLTTASGTESLHAVVGRGRDAWFVHGQDETGPADDVMLARDSAGAPLSVAAVKTGGT